MNTDPHAPLRDDVRWLGRLLGETLKEQVGPGLFEQVEEVRALAKAARATVPPAYGPLADYLAGRSVHEARDISRAFSLFLTLANICEQHHRVRRRRDYQRAGAAPQRGSFAETFERLLAEGASGSELRRAVHEMGVELVLTAHPTQVVRRTLLQKFDRIERILQERDRGDLTPVERQELEVQARRTITEIWGTDEVRRKKPTPLDEARSGLVVFERTLWDSVPASLRELDRILREKFGEGLEPAAAPIRFGSWMGGDRDGNPFVTATVTRRAVWQAQWMGVWLYEREVDALRDELSMREATPALVELSGGSREPYRHILRGLRDRLRATLTWLDARLAGRQPEVGVEPVRRAEEVASVLDACADSLRAVGHGRVATGRLLDLQRRLTAFGLHLVKIDIRQESDRHTEALAALTKASGLGDYASWSEQERVAFLAAELASGRPLRPRRLEATESVQEVLATFDMIADVGDEALGAYVISMARGASDVLAVHLLQREAGVERPLRVVPLFETEDDLLNAPRSLRTLFGVEPYRRAIGDEQEIMIGYSDSAKDAGRLASAWRLFEAQENIVGICREHGVRPTLFHGRGGTVGRGGGPTYLAIQSQPEGSVDRRLRVTEQGEMIDAKFGIPGIAERTLEIYVTATLEASVSPARPEGAAWRPLMEEMAQTSAAAYRAIVREHPDFVPYFRSATPEVELGYVNVGSRPSRRGKAKGGVESLRAIPWVFAWTQTRLMLPSWLGVGAALGAALDAGHQETLRDMYTNWRFFRSTMDLVQMVIAKADPFIARFYDDALVPAELRHLGEELRDALAKTERCLLKVTGGDRLLVDSPVLARSIAVRNPYVDPINLVQVELLRRLREHPDDETLLDALLVTVNGVAAGMRNTG